jgi:hypothetical protein
MKQRNVGPTNAKTLRARMGSSSERYICKIFTANAMKNRKKQKSLSNVDKNKLKLKKNKKKQEHVYITVRDKIQCCYQP